MAESQKHQSWRNGGGTSARRWRAGAVFLAVFLAVFATSLLAAPPGASAQATCDVQSTIISWAADHSPVIQDDIAIDERTAATDEFFIGGTLSDDVAFRAFVFEGEFVAGLQFFLLDNGSRAAAQRGLGSYTSGFLGAAGESRFDLTTEVAGVVTSGVVVDGSVIRMAETTKGRLSVAVSAVIEEFADNPAEEEAFLFEQLDRQIAAIPSACNTARVSDDRSGEAVGAAAGLALMLFGLPTMAAWFRDPVRRHKTGVRAQQHSQFVWHDVRLSAASETRHATQLAVSQLAGLGIAAVAALFYIRGEPLYLLAIPAGLLVAVLIPRLLTRMKRREQRGSVIRRGRRRPVAFAVLWISYVFVAFGVLGLVQRVYLATLSENDIVVRAALANQEPALYENMGFYLAFFSFLCAGGLQRLARWIAQLPATAAIKRDERPPVLLLRSFSDDNIKIRRRLSRHGLIGLLHFRRRERFEELLAWTLSDHGPVTIVANPRRSRTRLGAARERIKHDDWLTVVADRIRSAAVIVVVVGRTTGLDAELHAIRASGQLDRTVFVLPPLADAADRWAHAAHVLGVNPLLVADDKETAAVCFRDGQPHAFVGAQRDDATYVAALSAAIALRPAPVVITLDSEPAVPNEAAPSGVFTF